VYEMLVEACDAMIDDLLIAREGDDQPSTKVLP